MRESFTLPIKPFSINAMYYGDGRTKTQAARDWSYQVLHCLAKEDVAHKLERLRSIFNPETQGYIIRLHVTYPEDKFYTKKGNLSNRTMDLSNWEKPLIDLLFLPKYFDKEPPYGCQNLNIDDKYVVGLFSKKTIGERIETKISISIINLRS